MVLRIAHIRPNGLSKAIGRSDGCPTGSQVDADKNGFRHETRFAGYFSDERGCSKGMRHPERYLKTFFEQLPKK
jgi:hypothetical protein